MEIKKISLGKEKLLMIGEEPSNAKKIVLMLHGRGGTAVDILSLARHFKTERVSFIALQAEGNAWYPNRFMLNTTQNEPYLSYNLERIKSILETFKDKTTYLLGFSQGACLSLEFLTRNPELAKGAIALSGGLIGESEELKKHKKNLKDKKIFMGCSDQDPFIPLTRLKETEETLKKLGADVNMKIYPGMGHHVNDDEIKTIKGMLEE